MRDNRTLRIRTLRIRTLCIRTLCIRKLVIRTVVARMLLIGAFILPIGISPASPRRAAASPTSTGYIWPLGRRLGDGLLLLNYVDDDASSGVRDYETAPHTYNGHSGTDICLHDFREMDRGVPVLAGRGGRIVQVDDGNYDRNTSMNGTSPNQVIIEDDHGVRVSYVHLRSNSTTVLANETVAAGDVLGYVGSSGSSSVPHLHVEFRSATGATIDPWNGPSNPSPSLWAAQERYVGFDPLHVVDMGVFTVASAGGSVDQIPLATLEQRLSEPVQFGASEPVLAVWFQYQCQAGDAYQVDIVRPDGSVFASSGGTQVAKETYAYQYYWWTWAGRVPASAYGTWTARVVAKGLVIASRTFVVGATTRFAPRFWPVAGRSLRVAGSDVRDPLVVSSLGGPVTYRLVNAPAFVQLDGSTVVIPSTAHMTTRSATFQVAATDAAGLADTMWYHLVDPRVGRTVTAVDDQAFDETPGAPIRIAQVAPNPATGPATIRFTVTAPSRVSVTIHDVRGRRIRTLLNRSVAVGASHVEWDGRDDRGNAAPSGVYFIRAASDGRTVTRKIVVAR